MSPQVSCCCEGSAGACGQGGARLLRVGVCAGIGEQPLGPCTKVVCPSPSARAAQGEGGGLFCLKAEHAAKGRRGNDAGVSEWGGRPLGKLPLGFERTAWIHFVS